MAKRYWLLKTEPSCYGIDELERDGSTCWDGVRNYQARNFMREMAVGDMALFYHSGAEPPGVAGVARVCKTAYADHTALDPAEQHFDPKATKEKPIWEMVDVEFVERFPAVVALAQLRERSELADMLVLKRGQRLSVQPVEAEEFKVVRTMGRRQRAVAERK